MSFGSLPNQPSPPRGRSRYPYWTTREGVRMRLEDMSPSHLLAAIALMERNAIAAFPEWEHQMWAAYGGLQGAPDPDELDGEGWEAILPPAYDDMLSEAVRRGLDVPEPEELP